MEKNLTANASVKINAPANKVWDGLTKAASHITPIVLNGPPVSS